MKTSMLRFALPVFGLITATLIGQQPTAPVYPQALNYVKVTPGKGSKYVQGVIVDRVERSAGASIN